MISNSKTDRGKTQHNEPTIDNGPMVSLGLSEKQQVRKNEDPQDQAMPKGFFHLEWIMELSGVRFSKITQKVISFPETLNSCRIEPYHTVNM